MARKQSSAEKAFKQSEVRRLHNKAIKSTCKTYAKQFVEAVHAKDKALAEAKLKVLVRNLEWSWLDNSFIDMVPRFRENPRMITAHCRIFLDVNLMPSFNVSFAASAAN